MLLERADYAGLPRRTRRTWILTRRDRVVSARRQHAYMTWLGGVDTVLSVDTCHDVMLSEPSWLADRLIERCHLHRAADCAHRESPGALTESPHLMDGSVY
jgi:hypothetical protein